MAEKKKQCAFCRKEADESAVFCPYCGHRFDETRKTRRRGNGQGSAYKRGSSWMAVAVTGWVINKDGKPEPVRRTKSGFATKREALAYIPELFKAQTKAPEKKVSFIELYKRFAELHKERASHSTMLCYQAACNRFEKLHSRPFTEIGVDDFQDCITKCEQGRRTKENMKALIGLMYKYAISRNLCAVNYAPYLYVGNDETTTRPPFSEDELRIITEAAKSDPGAEIILCMIYTGFRPGELLSLTKFSYHHDGEYHYFVGGSKTEAGRDRTVTISPKILPYILKRVHGDSIELFPKPTGGAMSEAYFREEIFYPCLAKLGIQPVPDADHPARLMPYSCRHTFANLMKNVQGSDVDKASLMGHTDASMTKYYQSAEMKNIAEITNCI